MTGPLHVAYASDRRYLPWAATSMRSLLEQGRGATIHVLHLGTITPVDVGRLHEMVDGLGGHLVEHVIDRTRVGDLPAVDRFGAEVWLRLLLPDLLPDIGRVLYLDADTLVVGPVQDLWDIDLGAAVVGAVSNVVEPGMRAHVAALGTGGRFFNSGVLLLDLDALRRAGVTEEVVAFARTRAPDLRWPDQDALNAVLAERWHELHPRWNVQNSLWTWRRWATETFGAAQVAKAIADPAILHFEGPTVSKPWHYLSRHPWRDRYLETLARTPWADTPVEERTPATRLIKLLPGPLQLPAYRRLMR